MASQVKSQLSDKIYDTTLDDLLETDQGLEVDLYKINIFNKDIHIAPGKVMRDAKKDIYYCFVYAIKGGRVAAKIGVYETKDSRGEIYDLSEFEEGTLLLLDYYIQEPTALVEYQIQEPAESDNIFDYLKQYIRPITNETVTMKTQSTIIRKITMRISQNFPQETELLELLKLFRLKRPYDNEFLDLLKEQDSKSWMFILIVLELIFNIKFEFSTEGAERAERADELRNMVKETPNVFTDIILVSLEDTPTFIKVISNQALVVEDMEEPLVNPKMRVSKVSASADDSSFATPKPKTKASKSKASLEEYEPLGELPPIQKPREDSPKRLLVPTKSVAESKPANANANVNVYSTIPLKGAEELELTEQAVEPLEPLEPLEPEPSAEPKTTKRQEKRSSSEVKKIKRSTKPIPKPKNND